MIERLVSHITMFFFFLIKKNREDIWKKRNTIDTMKCTVLEGQSENNIIRFKI